MLRIWGRVNSINVQKVMWAVAELGVPYERQDAGMAFGVVNTPEYKAKNPNSRVPTIEDGNLVLWESNACVRYLAAKYGAGTLWPNDPGERVSLIASQPEKSAELARTLHAWAEDSAPTAAPPVSPEDAERLRELGYVQ